MKGDDMRKSALSNECNHKKNSPKLEKSPHMDTSIASKSNMSRAQKPEIGTGLFNEDEWELLDYQGDPLDSTKIIQPITSSNTFMNPDVKLPPNPLSQTPSFIDSKFFNKNDDSPLEEKLNEKTLQYCFDEDSILNQDVFNEFSYDKKEVCNLEVCDIGPTNFSGDNGFSTESSPAEIPLADTFKMKPAMASTSQLKPSSFNGSEFSVDAPAKDSEAFDMIGETKTTDDEEYKESEIKSFVHFSLSDSNLMQLPEDKKKMAAEQLFQSYHSLKMKKCEENVKMYKKNKKVKKHNKGVEENCTFFNIFGKVKYFVCENRIAFYSVAVCSAAFFGVLMLFCREWRKNQRLVAHLTKRDDALYSARRIPVHRSNSF